MSELGHNIEFEVNPPEQSPQSSEQNLFFDPSKKEILIYMESDTGERQEQHHPFQEFLYALRNEGIRVSTSEWLDLQKTLAEGEIQSVDELYVVGRALLVKDVTGYPNFDTVFGRMFYGIEPLEENQQENDNYYEEDQQEQGQEEQPESPTQKEQENIEEVVEATTFTSEEVHGGNEATKDIENSPNAANDGKQQDNHGAESGQSPENQQKSGEGGGQQKQHAEGGGNQQQGPGGGNKNEDGQGGGGSKNKENGGGKTHEKTNGGLKKGKGGYSSARERVTERKFDQYDKEKAVNYEQLGRIIARLSTIIQETTEIPTNRIDEKATVNRIANNAGVPEIVWKEEAENKPRVILMFDVGGSTDNFRPLMERLFAGAKDYLQAVDIYYFHNAIYGSVWTIDKGYGSLVPAEDIYDQKNIPFERLLQKHDPNSKVIIIGDAWMKKSELFGESVSEVSDGDMFFGLAYDHSSPEERALLDEKTASGYENFKRIANTFDHIVWINPIPGNEHEKWDRSGTIKAIKEVVPMFDLTLNGLEAAVQHLIQE